MKSMALGLAVLFVASGVFAVEGAGYRDFTDTEGRTIRARIVEYDSAKGRLLFERKTGAKAWVSPTVFSEKDRDYIQDWIAADQILSERSLRVSIEEKRSNNDRVSHELILGNYTKFPSKIVKIEYRYFVDEINFTGVVPSQKHQVGGVLQIAEIKAGDRAVLKTKPINLADVYEIRTRRKANDEVENYKYTTRKRKLVGVWIRMYGPLLDGVPAVRTICIPEGLDQNETWLEKVASSDCPEILSEVATQQARQKKAAQLEVDSLDTIKKRGKASSEAEFSEWIKTSISELGTLGYSEQNEDPRRLTVLEGIAFFYDPAFDRDGGYAYRIAKQCRRIGFYAKAIYWLELCSQNYFGAHELLAEWYSSASEEELHDGPMAVKHAKIALEEDKKSDKRIELLARAYARNGQFDLAVKTQEQAIERLMKSRKDEKDLAEYRKRLALYQNKQPYTEDAKKNS